MKAFTEGPADSGTRGGWGLDRPVGTHGAQRQASSRQEERGVWRSRCTFRQRAAGNWRGLEHSSPGGGREERGDRFLGQEMRCGAPRAVAKAEGVRCSSWGASVMTAFWKQPLMRRWWELGGTALGMRSPAGLPGKEVLRVTAARPPPDPALGETQGLGHPAEHRE